MGNMEKLFRETWSVDSDGSTEKVFQEMDDLLVVMEVQNRFSKRQMIHR